MTETKPPPAKAEPKKEEPTQDLELVMEAEKVQPVPMALQGVSLSDMDPMERFMCTMGTRWGICKTMVASKMIPQKTPAAALAVWMKAHELGIPMMQGFATIHYFESGDGPDRVGNLTLAAALMDGIAAERLGVRKKMIEWTDKVCKILYTRKGWDEVEASFTIEEAGTAGLLNKPNWRKYAKDMLAARAKARGLRIIAPDFFAGVYASEEFDGEKRLVGDDVHGTEAINKLLDRPAETAAAAIKVEPENENHGAGVPEPADENQEAKKEEKAQEAPPVAQESPSESKDGPDAVVMRHDQFTEVKNTEGVVQRWVCRGCGEVCKTQDERDKHAQERDTQLQNADTDPMVPSN